jgi:hypothetical protein
MLFDHLPRPVFWRPWGYVNSLELLESSHGVVAKWDMTAELGGESRHPLTVVELAGGKVIGSLRMVATRDDVVVGNVQSLAGLPEPQNHYLFKGRRRGRFLKRLQGKALVLGTGVSNNYYLWLMESLPRWRILQAAKYFDCDYVLLPDPPSPFEDGVLNRLGIPLAKRLRCSKHCVYQFDRLVVPSMAFPFRQPCPWACAWLRSLFPTKNAGPEKIYISRRNATRRELINESELELQLRAAGFVAIRPEQMPVAEQAAMFSSVKCVVGAHGAGLANMVFAPPHALLVELFHPAIIRLTYKNLAETAGLRYAAVIGHRWGKLAPGKDEEAKFTIEIPDVIEATAENESNFITEQVNSR